MAKTSFTEGNPAQGVPATIVTAEFLNEIQNHRHDGLDQDGSAPLNYAADTGAANACAIALTPALTAHVTGMPIVFKAAAGNTGASTLAINGLAAVALKRPDGSDLKAGDIAAGQILAVVYDGANYQVQGVGISGGSPVGMMANFDLLTAPAQWLTGNRGSVSRATYAALYGAIKTRHNFEFVADPATDILTTFEAAHGFVTGNAVDVYSDGTLPTGLVAGTTYYARNVSATTITLHSSSADATANTGKIDITAAKDIFTVAPIATFMLPEMRGEFIRGWDDGRGAETTWVTGTTTNASATITELSSTNGMYIGMPVSGTGIPGGATITAILSTTSVSISAAATASAAVTLTFTGRRLGAMVGDEFRSHQHRAVRDNLGGNIIAAGTGYGYAATGITAVSGNSETRPRSAAGLGCIKYI